MTKPELNCITDCNAACCRGGNLLLTGLTANQALLFLQVPGASVYSGTVEGHSVRGIMVPDGCILDGNRCPFHDTDSKPKSCVDIKPGSNFCLLARRDAGYKIPEGLKDDRIWLK